MIKGATTMIHTHQTAPTQFVEANGIRFAYRRFGKTGGVPIVFNQHYIRTMDYWDPTVTDDRTHPLGYGMETYFWSFVVALFVFFLGGLVAFYQGVRHILTPQPIVSPAISLGVLVVSALFEGWSFAVGFREYKRVVRGRDIPLWSFIKASKD